MQNRRARSAPIPASKLCSMPLFCRTTRPIALPAHRIVLYREFYRLRGAKRDGCKPAGAGFRLCRKCPTIHRSAPPDYDGYARNCLVLGSARLGLAWLIRLGICRWSQALARDSTCSSRSMASRIFSRSVIMSVHLMSSAPSRISIYSSTSSRLPVRSASPVSIRFCKSLLT